MTPADIEQAARETYNAINDTNWSSTEICTLIHRACSELTRDCGLVIERVYTESTVASTGEYAFPTNAVSIHRITYAGKKLAPITMRDDDSLTIQNQATTDTGEPQYYYIWDRTIFLRPIPQTAGIELKIFSLNLPQTVTPTSVLEVPTFVHPYLSNFVLSEMAAKDLNPDMRNYYRTLWKEDKVAIKTTIRMQKRSDAFNIVQTEELHLWTPMGPQ